ncbi:MAG: 6,7-dimethyl-8-ribityllumazine synthase [Bifidobacteriaceae bacterium]|jgi:6,7-dimethyl-8-ribityllumazine synthase|nr:6,7-dimethyl-8-ribityllumazine synthase [Bifidobacteriaceae bacterium]
MSGSGAPGADGLAALFADWPEPPLVAVVAASWHEPVMDGLIAGATRVLERAGARAWLLRVPGSFELPVAALRVLGVGQPPFYSGPPGQISPTGFHGGADAAVALGVVIRGGTPHFDYVCQAATHGLTEVALKTGKPVGFGLLTCDDEAQALARAGLHGSMEDKGAEAAEAALATLATLGRQ